MPSDLQSLFLALCAVPTPEAAPPAKDEPVKIGYKTFDSGSHASDYFHHLSNNLRHEQNLNEVSFFFLDVDLLMKLAVELPWDLELDSKLLHHLTNNLRHEQNLNEVGLRSNPRAFAGSLGVVAAFIEAFIESWA